jgi:hypothetical protein
MTIDYKVRKGDCISSIAASRGLLWNSVWGDPKNAKLKQLRGDPNVILPGDIVHIKDLEKGGVSAASDEKHTFKRKGIPAKLRLCLVEAAEEAEEPATESSAQVGAGKHDDPDYVPAPKQIQPRANIPYQLRIDALTLEGSTDGDGCLEESIAPTIKSAKLVLNPGTEEEETFHLRLGCVDPINDLAGVRERLSNLGYAVDNGNNMSATLEAALRAFQEHNELDITGLNDQSTKDKLVELHGS